MPTVSSTGNSYYQNVRTHEEKSKMGKDDFLKILVTQIRHQDPLQPLQDKEFIGQMTQFSTLEQIVNLNQSFQNFANSQGGLSTYATSIGKEITWLEDGTVSKTGTVTGVATKEGKIHYMVDGKEVPVELVDSIRQPQT